MELTTIFVLNVEEDGCGRMRQSLTFRLSFREVAVYVRQAVSIKHEEEGGNCKKKGVVVYIAAYLAVVPCAVPGKFIIWRGMAESRLRFFVENRPDQSLLRQTYLAGRN